jgi:hypothetical protein
MIDVHEQQATKGYQGDCSHAFLVIPFGIPSGTGAPGVLMEAVCSRIES